MQHCAGVGHHITILGTSSLIWWCDDLPATITPVPGAAVPVFLILLMMGAWRPKHVEWLCRNKTCTVLHQVGVLFDWHVGQLTDTNRLSIIAACWTVIDRHLYGIFFTQKYRAKCGKQYKQFWVCSGGCCQISTKHGYVITLAINSSQVPSVCCHIPTDRQTEWRRQPHRTHARTHQHTIQFTCPQTLSVCSTCLPHSCAFRPPGGALLYAICTALWWGKRTHRQTDGRPQFYASIVHTSVNTVSSFKHDSSKQRNPAHCGTFALFWTTVRRHNDVYWESKRMFGAGNGCQPALHKLLSSCLLCENVNVQIYIIAVLTAFIWVWNLVCRVREEHRPRVFKNRCWGRCASVRGRKWRQTGAVRHWLVGGEQNGVRRSAGEGRLEGGRVVLCSSGSGRNWVGE